MERETCKCGAVYEVTGYGRLPARDRDKFECNECGEVIRSWNATSYPQFKKVQPGGKSMK